MNKMNNWKITNVTSDLGLINNLYYLYVSTDKDQTNRLFGKLFKVPNTSMFVDRNFINKYGFNTYLIISPEFNIYNHNIIRLKLHYMNTYGVNKIRITNTISGYRVPVIMIYQELAKYN